MASGPSPLGGQPAWYRTIWRWHFYAGLVILPLVVLLALSGTAYLFKPQVDRLEEASFHGWPARAAVAPSEQVAHALAARPGTRLGFYRVPERPGDSAMVQLVGPAGNRLRQVFVSPQGRVLGELDPDRRIMALVRDFHGQLLLGRRGSWLVELAASWAILMILGGLALWWPRGWGLGGVLWPRLSLRGRAWWRDGHAVTGFWISGLMLVMLASGLPWADAWGSAFKAVREAAGLAAGRPDWTIGGRGPDDPHAGHHGGSMAMPMAPPATPPLAPLDQFVARARSEGLAFPAVVVPPGAPGGEGGKGAPARGWLVKSEAQNRPLRVTLRFDTAGAGLIAREDFASKHPIDRAVGYGVAWHEGQLLGPVNLLVELLGALGLLFVVASGLVMWRRRRPAGGGLGAPPRLRAAAPPPRWMLVVLGALVLLLPLLAASLAAFALFDRLVLPRWPGLARWLGAAPMAADDRQGIQ